MKSRTNDWTCINFLNHMISSELQFHGIFYDIQNKGYRDFIDVQYHLIIRYCFVPSQPDNQNCYNWFFLNNS